MQAFGKVSIMVVESHRVTNHIPPALSYVFIVVIGSIQLMLLRLAKCQGTTCEDVQRLVMYKSSGICLHTHFINMCTGADLAEYVVYHKRIQDRGQSLQCMQWNYIMLVSRGDWPRTLPLHTNLFTAPVANSNQLDPCTSHQVSQNASC